MEIWNNKEIAAAAREKCQGSGPVKKVTAVYAAIALGGSGLVSVLSYLISLEISQSGGLGKMGLRAMLSSLQTVLPLALNVAMIFLELGFLAAMLRTARGQYLSPNTLKLGLDRVGLIAKCSLIQALTYLGLLFVSVYVGSMLYMFTPLADSAMAIVQPYLDAMTVMDSGLSLDESTYLAFAQAIYPAYILMFALFAALAGPVWYGYRMVNYLIIDKPGLSARTILWESKRMMRGKRWKLLKLDLRMLWYPLAMLAVTILGYGDVFLPLLGVMLPGSEDVWYFLFLGVYLAGMFCVYYFLRPWREVRYALVYEALLPKPEPEAQSKKPDGIILGNIFEM